MDAIENNELAGWLLWGATLLVAGAVTAAPRVRARGWRGRWPFLILIVLHPGWWMSARSGDCGYTLRDGSILMTAMTLLVGGIIYWRARRTPRGSVA